MNQKEYLLQLLQQRSDDVEPELKNKILAGIDTFSDAKIEKLIAAFERSNERKRRIAAGEAGAVLGELKTERAQKKGAAVTDQIKSIRQAEESQKLHDEAEAEALLAELDAITSEEPTPDEK